MDEIKLFKFLDRNLNVPLVHNLTRLLYFFVFTTLILVGLGYVRDTSLIQYSFIELFVFFSIIVFLIYNAGVKISNMDNIFLISSLFLLVNFVALYHGLYSIADIFSNLFSGLFALAILLIPIWKIAYRDYIIKKYDIPEEINDER